MKSVNRVTLLGHTVADLELKKTKNGKEYSIFSVATNNEWLDQEGTLQKSTDFHRIVAWNKLAELCEKFLKKGDPVYIEGRLSNRSYLAKDETKHYMTEVILQSLHLITSQSKRIETMPLESMEKADKLKA